MKMHLITHLSLRLFGHLGERLAEIIVKIIELLFSAITQFDIILLSSLLEQKIGENSK